MMKMLTKRLLLLVVLLVLRSLSASAQYGFGFYEYKNVELISKQPLIVLLTEEDPKELEKLANKPEEIAHYKAYVAYINSQIQQLAPQFWKFSPSVEFRPKSELPTLKAAKDKRAVVLYYVKQKVGVSRSQAFGPIGGVLSAWMQLSSLGDGQEKRECSAALPLDAIYPSDIIIAFKQLQRALQTDVKLKADMDRPRKEQLQEARAMLRAEGDANAESIRTKPLLVAQDDVDKQLTEATIKQLYPFPFQLVPRATIEEAVRTGDTHYNYVRWYAANAASVGPRIIDTADGRVLGNSYEGGVSSSGLPIIGKRELKDFAAYADSKVSRRHLGVN
jgi:hypothetical protein